MLVGCSGGIKVPDVSGADETTARSVMTKNDITPTITYDYSDTVPEGLVIKTDPSSGTSVKKNDKVSILVSKGPSIIKALNAIIAPKALYGAEYVEYNFYAPVINKGNLEINVKLLIKSRYSFSWKLLGTASVTEILGIPVGKTVPIQMTELLDGRYLLSIPLEGLDVKKPTTLSVSLSSLLDNKPYDVYINFTISW